MECKIYLKIRISVHVVLLKMKEKKLVFILKLEKVR